MKIIETRCTVVGIPEGDRPLTFEDIDNPSPYGPTITIREIVLQPRHDIAGRPCHAAYDRATDTLFVRWEL